MRTIIATIKPQHALNIKSGNKHWELRKNSPYCLDGRPFRVLICQSKSGGQIDTQFICDHVDIYTPGRIPDYIPAQSCVTMADIERYTGRVRPLFCWHVSEVKPYTVTEKDKDGNEVTRCGNIHDFGLTSVPQSWQYVDEAPIKNGV